MWLRVDDSRLRRVLDLTTQAPGFGLNPLPPTGHAAAIVCDLLSGASRLDILGDFVVDGGGFYALLLLIFLGGGG